MRTFAIFLCSLCFVSYTLVRADLMNELPTSCLEKYSVSLVDIPMLLRDQSPEAARKRGCIEACYLQKLGMMDGNNLVLQKFDEQINKIPINDNDKEVVRQHVHQCIEEAEDGDECMAAQKFSNCTLEQLKFGAEHLLLRLRSQL